MACNIIFRGEFSSNEVNKSYKAVTNKKTIEFVDWCPTGLKIEMSNLKPMNPPGDDILTESTTS